MSKTLNRIGSLLAKAESTDSEHEREALMSKAQSIATLAAIDLETARQRQADKTRREAPIKKTVQLLPEGVTQLRTHFVSLASLIVNNNDLRMTYYAGNKNLITNLFGFPSDIDVMELLFASLAYQMKSAADAYIKSGEYKGDTWEDFDCSCRECQWNHSGSGWHMKFVDARVARNQFYTEFLRSIGTRMHEARRDAIKEATVESTGTDLVLASKTEEVNEFYRETSGRVVSARGANFRDGGKAGGAGRQAGNSARLSAARGVSGMAGSIAS